MGMFDYLVCEHPLPDGRVVEGPVWQTKDSPCQMGVVTITADGRLLFEESHVEAVPEEQRPFFGTPRWAEGGLFQMCGMSRRVVDRVVEHPFHGDLRFYNGREEYIARFTEGRLSSMRKVSK